jgi:hypothetical protein
MSSVFSADSGDASVIASQLASRSAGESAIASRRTNNNKIVPRKMPIANLGVDLGGTKIETIALDDNGAIVLRRRVPTPGGDYSGTVRASRSRGLQRRQRGGVAVAYREDQENGDPHEEIVRLEEHIEELAAKIESCRKFILASRIAVAGGGLVLAAMLVGAIRSDLGLMAAAVSLLLSGIVVWGSNSSTAKEATKELAASESERAALIEHINPRVIFIAKRRTDLAEASPEPPTPDSILLDFVRIFVQYARTEDVKAHRNTAAFVLPALAKAFPR